MQGAAEAVSEARKQLAGSSDLERALARLHANMMGATGRDAANVVLYEDAAKRKVSGFRVLGFRVRMLEIGRRHTHTLIHDF